MNQSFDYSDGDGDGDGGDVGDGDVGDDNNLSVKWRDGINSAELSTS